MQLNIAITGHRTSGLKKHTADTNKLRSYFELALDWSVEQANQAGADHIHYQTGGALGADQAMAWLIVDKKFMYRGKKLSYDLYIPFPLEVFSRYWDEKYRLKLQRLQQNARIVYPPLSDTYQVWRLQERNEMMVNDAAMVIAFWNGDLKGGTFNAIRYALKKANPIRPCYNALNDMRPIEPGQLSKPK